MRDQMQNDDKIIMSGFFSASIKSNTMLVKPSMNGQVDRWWNCNI